MPDDTQSAPRLVIEYLVPPWYVEPPWCQNLEPWEQSSDLSATRGGEYFILVPSEEDPMLASYNLLAPLFGKEEATHGLPEHCHLGDTCSTEYIATNNGLDPEVETVTVAVCDEEDDVEWELHIHFSVFIMDPCAYWAVSVSEQSDLPLLKDYLANLTPPIHIAIGDSVTIRDLKKQLEELKRSSSETEQELQRRLSATSELLVQGFAEYPWSRHWRFLPKLPMELAKKALISWVRQGQSGSSEIGFLLWILGGRSSDIIEWATSEYPDLKTNLYDALNVSLQSNYGSHATMRNPGYRRYKINHEKLEAELSWLKGN